MAGLIKWAPFVGKFQLAMVISNRYEAVSQLCGMQTDEYLQCHMLSCMSDQFAVIGTCPCQDALWHTEQLI